MVDKVKIFSSTFWSGVESGGLAILSFVALIVFTRTISPSDIGLFAIVFALIEILLLFPQMLFHDALVQTKDADELDFDTAFASTTVLGFTLGALCVFSADFIATTFEQPRLRELIYFMALMLPINATSATIIARQRRQFAFKSLALRSIIGRLFGATVGIATAVLGGGVWSLVLQQLCMASASSLVLWFLCDAKPRFRFSGGRCLPLVKYGVSAMAALILNFSIKRIFILLIGGLLGTSEAGFLSIAFRTVDTLWSLSAAAVQQVALPMFARLQGDDERMKKAYVAAVGLSCAILYPCFIGFAYLARDFTGLLFGDKWLLAANYISPLACVALLQVPRIFVGPILSAKGYPEGIIPGLLLAALITFGIIFAFGLRSSFDAIVLWVLCEIIIAPVNSYMLWWRSGIDVWDQVRGLIPPLFCVIVMVGGMLLVEYCLGCVGSNSLRVLILVTSGAIIYAVSYRLAAPRNTAQITSMVRAYLNR